MRACLLVLLAGCTSGLPRLELDVSANPVGPQVLVAPCHPGETMTQCNDHFQNALMADQASDTVGIFNIPSSVSGFTLLVNEVGVACGSVGVTLSRDDQKIAIVAGATLTITCERDGDCQDLSIGACP